MEVLDLLRKEYAQEIALTKQIMERVPEGKWDYKPHEKSMSMAQLTTHLAEIPSWSATAMESDVLDFAVTPFQLPQISSKEELLKLLNKSIDKGTHALAAAKVEDLDKNWTMRHGEKILMSMNKYEVIRHSLNQLSHHRAQLGVYLRLLDIPVPATYGPSADEQNFGM